MAKRAGFYDRADYRAALMRAVEMAEPADVILVGRPVDAPWGRYSHVMIVVSTPIGKALIHAYETGVQLTPVSAAPMCGKVAVVRIDCTPEQREAMVSAAWSQLAMPFKLSSRKPDAAAQSAFNCIGLVAWASAQAGVTLDDIPVGGVIVPDDILTAKNVRIIFDWQDGDGPNAPVAPVSKPPLLLLSDGTELPVPTLCAHADDAATTMIRSELFLGLTRQDGQHIADSEMSAFVDEEVVPRFPAGTTQVAANGTYGSLTAGVIHERSRLLTILHPNDKASVEKIHEIAAIYRIRFHQEAVLISMSPALVFGVAA